jgi:lipoprotein-anchoring transpeptidase ErfK/SrfK
MRSLLGRTAAVTVAGLTLFVGVTAAGAQADTNDPVECDASSSTSSSTSTSTTAAPSSSTTTTVDPCSTTTSTTSTPPPEPAPVAVADTVETSSTSSTPSSSTTQPPTTTQPPLLVAEVQNPLTATPSRGTSAQVAETLPPPSTTTTTTTIPKPPEYLLPANSGTGYRVVYRKTYPMRVWLVNSDGSVAKTHLVSGRADWNQPTPGTYSVFSRSSYTCNINNPHICWRYMVRFTKGPGGDNIGFHEIPTNLKTGYKLQSESQLGLALSGGCVRQRTSDAQYMWGFAPIGTKVVVLP